MEIKEASKVFEALEAKREKIAKIYKKSMRYYRNKNDILWNDKGDGTEKLDTQGSLADASTGLRVAKNRVSNGFHRIITDQATQYTGGVVPVIDVDDDAVNEKITETLGDNFDRYFTHLITDANNAGIAWIHYWIDDKTNAFKYSVINPTQITAIYNDLLEHEIIAVRRTYEKLDTTDGEMYIHDEYWTDKEAFFFKRPKGTDYSQLVYDYKIPLYDTALNQVLDNAAQMTHDFGRVPFIPFSNNQESSASLTRYKGLIDVYDRVFAGFVDDIDDVQQVILTLTNYGGEEKSSAELLRKIKLEKVLKVDALNPQDKAGLDTLTIDIPVEARNALLDRTREAIFLQAQAVDPTKVEMGTNKSGVALKMLYSLLELKAAALESEFRPALAALIRAVMKYNNVQDFETRKIEQTWTRAAIKDAAEMAQIISQLSDDTSTETKVKNNPLVEDPERELEELDRERTEQRQNEDMFANPQAMAQVQNDNQPDESVTDSNA